MIKIRFLDDQVVYAGDKVEQRFKAGQVTELSDASARHWLSRNLAEFYMGKAEKKEAEEPPKEPRNAGGEDHSMVAGVKAQKPAKAPKKRRFGPEDDS